MKSFILMIALGALLTLHPQTGRADAEAAAKEASNPAGRDALTKYCEPPDRPKTIKLTLGECLKLGGAVSVDTSCQETTSTNSATGSTIKGTFKCRGQGQSADQGVCVNESG